MFEIDKDPIADKEKADALKKLLEETKYAFAHKEREYQQRIGELNLELLAAKKESKPVQTLRKSVLKAEEVCSIISTCGTANVSELSFGDLHVRFGAPKPERQPEPLAPVGQSQPTTPPSPETVLSEKEADRIAKETLELQELLTREQQMAELNLTDPVEYERQLAAGELEDAPRASEDT